MTLLAALAASLALAGPPTDAPSTKPPGACAPDGVKEVRLRGEPRVYKLGDLPKARLMLPVLRRVEGCNIPTFVSGPTEGDGRFARPRAEAPR